MCLKSHLCKAKASPNSSLRSNAPKLDTKPTATTDCDAVCELAESGM